MNSVQTSYPRTASIRKNWVVRQFIKLIVFTGLMGFIIEQVSVNSSISTTDVHWSTYFLVRIFCQMLKYFFLQYINPIVQNSQHPLKANFLYAIERILKLSVPNTYVWLCMFYSFFHLWYISSYCFRKILTLSLLIFYRSSEVFHILIAIAPFTLYAWLSFNRCKCFISASDYVHVN